MSEERKRTIKLFCPSLSKMVELVAWEDQRIDLGSISRTFGLDPQTIRLNGHFISRGVDLIASSVTWKSLLSFFSARGLPTGTAGSRLLFVDGKLCKVGAKRAHGPVGVDNVINCTDEWGNAKPLHEDTSLFKKSRFRESEYDNEVNKMTKSPEISSKRKQWLDAVSPRQKTIKFCSSTNRGAMFCDNDKSTKCPEIGLKRKQLLDAVRPQKKTRTNETKLERSENTLSGTLLNLQLS